MVRTALLAAALTVGLWVATARAQTPWGGDDTGTLLPPKDAAAKCETGAAKAVTTLDQCIRKCHARRFAQPNNNPDATEDKCEDVGSNSCMGKFASAIGRLTGCPPCINSASMAALAAATEQRVEAANDALYCAAGTPWGGDDTGFLLPPRQSIWFCERGAAGKASKLERCIRECHAHRFGGQLSDETAEDACESSCTATFATAIAKLKNCPACINDASMAVVAAATEVVLDAENGQVYCASPSGAFVQ